MRFTKTPLEGAFLIELEEIRDVRGFFSRTFCLEEFHAHGLNFSIVQENLSFTKHSGTMRGLHYQRSPFEEAKLIRCISGRIWDVIVDLRKDSPTVLQSFGAELSDQNRHAMYVPEGFAHGFLSLTDDVEVSYAVSTKYTPAYECGLRFDDPALAIKWPEQVKTVSDKDLNWSYLEKASS